MATLERIESSLVLTRYQSQTIVNEPRGVYYWDCSGMATWILRRSAPVARLALHSGRPVARNYYDVIARSPVESSARGWTRLAHPDQIRPGDLVSWLKPPHWKRNNTGHVAFIMTTAKRHPRFDDVWLMRIADATSVRHGDDTRPKKGDGGFGIGTIAFRVDPEGQPWAYGWYGARQPPDSFVPTEIAFGRVVK